MKDNIHTKVGASSNTGFFLEEKGGKGQYDWNEQQYREKQIKFAADLEQLGDCEFWMRKGKFSEYDYDLTLKGSDSAKGAALIVPGIPVFGYAELKYRNVSSTRFDTTVVDTEKMKKLMQRSVFTNLPVYVCWRFSDIDMYYQVAYQDLSQFKIRQGRNTHTSEDSECEYKQLTYIPMTLLSTCNKNMFKEIK
tara:strand:+ start:115 stop:693 length:579 start_codon:yes stop_codon:yes gene_type:complete